VIAYRAGGAEETVVDGKTGCSSISRTRSLWAKPFEQFESMHWSQILLRRHAEKFDRNVFRFSCLAISCSVAPAVLLGRVVARCASAFRKYFASSLAETCGGWIKPMETTSLFHQSSRSAAGAAMAPAQVWKMGPTAPVIWPNEVHVWRARLDVPWSWTFDEALTLDDRARADRFRLNPTAVDSVSRAPRCD